VKLPVRHVLITNDFPPKIGGIQSYLWELWRRLPPEDVTILTTAHVDANGFDSEQRFRIERVREPVLLPSPGFTRRVKRLVAEVDARAVIIDPALPLGLVGRKLPVPYGLILHGAEIAVPGRLPATRQVLARVVRGSSLLIAAGGYPEAEARRAVGNDNDMPPVVRIPPGVDATRFAPMSALDRAGTRARLGLPVNSPLVLSVSRLVPRKGMDTLITAAAQLSSRFDGLVVAIAGVGRDRTRLEHQIRRTGAPVRLLGHVSNPDLPALYASADVFAMSCRSRWRGLEQEGFGIVFLEAAATGMASVAGHSGGSAEAVIDGQTGLVIDRPDDPAVLAEAVARLLSTPELARHMGAAARRRAQKEYSYDQLAQRLADALEKLAIQAA
jgi:phosphatidylinositol alpha-1,6-mannosyltransferase